MLGTCSPDGLQGSIDLEHLCNCGDALSCVGSLTLHINTAEFIAIQTASEKRKQTSAAADGRETMRGGVLEGLEGGVGLQRLRDVPCALCTSAVVVQTASGS